MYKQFGHHYILEVIGVDQLKLNDIDFFHNLFYEQQKISNSTQLEFHYHKFEPMGITQILLLQESHISVHTFPEDEYQQIDLFTCTKENPIQQIEYIINQLQPKQYDLRYIPRGIPKYLNMGNLERNRLSNVYKGINVD